MSNYRSLKTRASKKRHAQSKMERGLKSKRTIRVTSSNLKVVTFTA